jgi:septum formation protein
MQNPSAPQILLASASRYRQGLLDRFLDDYETVTPDVDESPEPGENPEALAGRLARKKAETVSSTRQGALIIGADQLAVLDGTVLGKPGDHQKAVEQLLAASGKAVRFLTAVCVLDPASHRRYEHIDTTTVRFRQFDRRLADAYLHHDKPYDCAGSFKIEGAGFVLFESVTTDDPTALIGLPMIWLAGTLQELDYLLPRSGECAPGRAGKSRPAETRPRPPLRVSSFPAANPLQETIEVIRQRRSKMQFITAVIGKRYRLGVQKQAPEPEFLHRRIDLGITVTLVSR